MEREELRSIVESLLFVAEGPLTIQRLGEVLEDVEKDDIRTVAEELRAELESNRRGVRLVEVAGGYQLRTAKVNAGGKNNMRLAAKAGTLGDHRL